LLAVCSSQEPRAVLLVPSGYGLSHPPRHVTGSILLALYSSQAAPRCLHESHQVTGSPLLSSCSSQAAPCCRRPSCHPTHRARPYPYSCTVDLPPWLHPRPSPSVRSASTSCARGCEVSPAALTASITSVAASSIWLHLCPAPSEHHVPVAGCQTGCADGFHHVCCSFINLATPLASTFDASTYLHLRCAPRRHLVTVAAYSCRSGACCSFIFCASHFGSNVFTWGSCGFTFVAASPFSVAPSQRMSSSSPVAEMSRRQQGHALRHAYSRFRVSRCTFGALSIDISCPEVVTTFAASSFAMHLLNALSGLLRGRQSHAACAEGVTPISASGFLLHLWCTVVDISFLSQCSSLQL
jgi:hypothetical protein